MKTELKGWLADNTVTTDNKEDKILVLESAGNLTLSDVLDFVFFVVGGHGIVRKPAFEFCFHDLLSLKVNIIVWYLSRNEQNIQRHQKLRRKLCVHLFQTKNDNISLYTNNYHRDYRSLLHYHQYWLQMH